MDIQENWMQKIKLNQESTVTGHIKKLDVDNKV